MITMLLEAKDMTDLGNQCAELAKAHGAGTTHLPETVDPRALLRVLQAWAHSYGGDVRLIRIPVPGEGRTGRPRYMTVDQLEELARAAHHPSNLANAVVPADE